MLYQEFFYSIYLWFTRHSRCEHGFKEIRTKKTSWDGCFTTTRVYNKCEKCGKKKKVKYYDLTEDADYYFM